MMVNTGMAMAAPLLAECSPSCSGVKPNLSDPMEAAAKCRFLSDCWPVNLISLPVDRGKVFMVISGALVWCCVMISFLASRFCSSKVITWFFLDQRP